MKYILLLVICLGNTVAYNQESRHIILEGKVGWYPITLELYCKDEHSNPEFYHISYFYHSQDIRIDLYSTENSIQGGDSLNLESNLGYWSEPGDIKEYFNGIYMDGIYSGVWRRGDRKMNFELKEAGFDQYTEMNHYLLERVVPYDLGREEFNHIEAGTVKLDYYLPKNIKLRKLMWDDKYLDFYRFANTITEEYESEFKKGHGDVWKGIDPFHEYHYYHIVMNSRKYLVYEYRYFYIVRYGVWSKEKNAWIDLDDVLNLDYENEIESVLDKVLRKKYHIPVGVKLNEATNSFFIRDSVYLTGNFILSNTGIHFHYDVFEMTPRSKGHFRLFVPYEELQPYLKKKFKY